MIDKINEVFSRAETKSDIATILIAGTAGYIIDAQLNIFGMIEPAIVGPLFASGALGIKKTFEERLTSYKNKKTLLRRTDNLLRILDQSKLEKAKDAKEKIKDQLSLYIGDLISDEDFETYLNLVIEELYPK